MRNILRIEEPEISAIPRLTVRGGTAVDVGANAGFYTRALAAHFDLVHAFEPNADVIAPAVRWGHPAVHIHQKALSSQKGVGLLHVPVVDGVTLTGWGSLNPNWLSTADHVLSLSIQVDCLDSYELDDVRLIKIDVEGWELDVLRGALNTIRKNRPVLLVETTGPARTAVLDLLRPLSYRSQDLENVTGVRGSLQNILLFPDEYRQPLLV